MMKPDAPLIVGHGAHWNHAMRVLEHLPRHVSYAEVCGGSGAVLLRKSRADQEIFNDPSNDVGNLFEVLRSGREAQALLEQVLLTPFSRLEVERAHFEGTGPRGKDPVENARCFLLRSYAASAGIARYGGELKGALPARVWAGLPARLLPVIERLRGVTIDRLDPVEAIRVYDGRDALLYVAPATPRPRKGVPVDALNGPDTGHLELLGAALGAKGMVVVSAPPSPIYRTALADWTLVPYRPKEGSGRRETPREALWLNAAATEELRTDQLSLRLEA